MRSTARRDPNHLDLDIGTRPDPSGLRNAHLSGHHGPVKPSFSKKRTPSIPYTVSWVEDTGLQIRKNETREPDQSRVLNDHPVDSEIVQIREGFHRIRQLAVLDRRVDDGINLNAVFPAELEVSVKVSRVKFSAIIRALNAGSPA